MINKYTFIIVLFLFSFYCCKIVAQDQNVLHRDSLWKTIPTITDGEKKYEAYTTLIYLYRRDIKKPNVIDTVMNIYDKLDQWAIEDNNTTRRGTLKFNRLLMLDSFDPYIMRKFVPETKKFLKENELWINYNNLWDLLISSYSKEGKLDLAIDEANKFYDEAKERKEEGGIGVALLALAKLYNTQRRYAEAEKNLRESIVFLSNEKYYLPLLATAHDRLLTSLTGQKKYEEAEKVVLDTEKVNQRYEKESKTIQPIAWLNLYICCVDLYRQKGDADKAQFYLNKVDSMSNRTYNMDKQRGHILYLKKEYSKAIEVLDRAISNARPGVMEPQQLKLMTLIQMGEADKAHQISVHIVEQQDSLFNAYFETQIDELRTRYEVDKINADKERNRNYFYIAVGGCILLLLSLFGVSYYNRLISQKNKSLFKQIKEHDKLQQELSKNKNQKENIGSSNDNAENKYQKDLVHQLKEFLLSDNQLSTASINREEFIVALGINKNTLSEAVKNITGKTLMEYIRFLQLEEARRILEKHPEFTIEAIALDCGFNAQNTFYRQFRKNYGISPNEYRKMILEEE